jgi:hypothetical protein
VLLPIQRPVDNPPVVNSILSFQKKKQEKKLTGFQPIKKEEKKKNPQETNHRFNGNSDKRFMFQETFPS